MVSFGQQEKAVFLNSQYQENNELIHKLQDKLLQDIHTLDLSNKDFLDAKEYIQDKVTIFRFLRDCKFDFDKAHERLLKTIRWRIECGICDLTWESCIEFFDTDHGAFSFYHKTDKTNQPLIFVRVRYFPREFRDPTKRLIHHIQRYACLMMEMGRKQTWQITCDREKQGEQCVLVSQMTVVVNISKAPIIPIDVELIKTMSMILDERFPKVVGTVNILNFSWMYQGIWTVVKYLLSEAAKNSIKFTSANELKPIISSDSLLKEMGGDNNYSWTFESDETLQNFGTGKSTEVQPVIEELPNAPPISEDRSRSNSICSSIDGNDMYFDASDALPSIPITPPLLESHNEIIPHPIMITQLIPTKTNLTSTTLLPGTSNYNTKSYYGNLSSWAGLRMGVEFLTSFIDTKKGGHGQKKMQVLNNNLNNNKDLSEPLLPPSSDIIVVNPEEGSSNTNDMMQPPNTVIAVTGFNLKRIEMYLKKLSSRLIQLSFGQQGMLYWVLLYVFLRGPVESLVRKSLVWTSIVRPTRMNSTTIGITAAIAAVVSTSLSSTVERFCRPPHL